MATGGRCKLSTGLEGLNLGGLGIPGDVAKSLGTIPKVKASPAAAEETAKASPEPHCDKAAETPQQRRRRNRRQRKKKANSDPDRKVDDPLLDNDASAGRIPEMPPLVSLEALQEEHLSCEGAGAAALPESSPPAAKKAGQRKRRGGNKRKKQRSPEPKATDNKENEKLFAEVKSDYDDDDDDDDDDECVSSSGETKYIWRSVTKNGWIKKCILVHGQIENGRPKSGDTALVKSQGKLKDGTIIDDYPTLVFGIGEHEVIEGLDLAVQSMYKNELSIISVKPEMAYGAIGRKGDVPVPADARITYLVGLLHFEKAKEISQLTWEVECLKCVLRHTNIEHHIYYVFRAQRRKSGQSRMRLANWWYQRKEYPVAVRCYKKALEYYNNIPTNQECSTAEEYKELLQLMEERLRVMRQVANIFKRIANLIQSGQISS